MYPLIKSQLVLSCSACIEHWNSLSFLEIKGEGVLIFFPGHAPPLQLRGGEVKNFRKVFAGGVRHFYFGGGNYIAGWGGVILLGEVM